MPQKWFALLAFGLLLCGTSCVQTAREAARAAAPAAVEGAVEEAEDPGTRLNVAKIMQDPMILEASSELSKSVARGVMEGLAAQESEAELERLTASLVAAFGAEMSESLRKDIGPTLARTFAESSEGVVKRSLDADVERWLQELARTTTRGSVQGLVEAMRDSDGTLSLAVGRVARDVGREAALGVNDAISQRVHEAERTRAADDGQFLTSVGKVADATADGLPLVFWGVAFLISAVVIAMFWLVLRLRRQLDRLAAQLSRSERLRDSAGTLRAS